MPLRSPEPPRDALAAFSARAPVPSVRNTNDWNRVAPEIRAGAFFSAKVEDARFLDRAKALIEDHLKGARDADGQIKVGGKAQFVEKMQAFMVQEGMVRPGEFGDPRDITNIAGSERLRLIFDTNARQAFGYAHRSQGMAPLILDAWPAQEFVRLEDPEEPRPRHVAGEGDIRLKTDVAYWADHQNGFDIGGFGVPYAPFGFNSLMDTEDVDRATAESLGLIAPGQPAFSTESENQRRESPEATLQASTKTMDPAIRRKLYDELRKQDDRQLDQEALEQESADRGQEALLYAQMDALNTTGASPRQLDQIDRELAEIDRRREARDTGYIFRIRRAAGGLLRFLGDKLFRG